MDNFNDSYLDGNEQIEQTIHQFYQDQSEQNLLAICMAVRKQMKCDRHLVFPADTTETENGETMFSFKTLEYAGNLALVAFTSQEELKKGPPSGAVSQFIDSMLEPLLQMEHISGLVLNPWGESMFLDKEDVAVILNSAMEGFMGGK